MREIKKAAVLGAGVMGAAVAAHLANCGISVLLLDIVPPKLDEKDRGRRDKRNAFAAAGLAGLAKAKPSPLYSKRDAALIEIGNFEDDLPKIADCDWICEAVKEDAEIKRALFAQVAKYRSADSVISTNTSGIPLRELVIGMEPAMRTRFLGTHFFNPPRYMKLFELIPCEDTAPEIMEQMAWFGENVLGKGIVYAKDTPNFVANRIVANCTIGAVLAEMANEGLTVEEVDALMGPVIGRPASGIFRTFDIVGLDILSHVMATGRQAASPEDEPLSVLPEWLKRMIERNLLGDKTGSGAYKKTAERDERGKSVILSIRPDTLEYGPQKAVSFECLAAARKGKTLEDKIRIMHTGADAGSRFVWNVFARTALYAAARIPEIADDIVNVDNGLKWGFGWDLGIFETWDAIGFRTAYDRMQAESRPIPPLVAAMLEVGAESFYKTDENGRRCYFDLATKTYAPVPVSPNAIRLDAVKRAKGVIRKTDTASLVDLGDGVLCAEFHGKMNTIESDVISVVQAGVDLVNDGQFVGMVLGNQGPHFTAGANLVGVMSLIENNDWDGLLEKERELHAVNMHMRYCRGPVVSAPHHYCFGGGIEMSQHCARVVMAGETYGGLVEAGIGVIPGGGGTKEMLRRALEYVPETVPDGNAFPYLRRAFETVAMAKVSTSGRELIDLGYFTEADIVCPSFENQIKRAKDVCLGLVQAGYTRPRPAMLAVLGAPVRAAFQAVIYNLTLAGYASEHDALVATRLAYILTGGDRPVGTLMTEQDVLDLECEAFVSLCGTEKTQKRIQHMLATGKPLRN